MTPRLNPDVNSYWMCDIGRFDYHWVEGETRLRRPLMLQRARCWSRRRGTTSSRRLRDSIQSAGAADPGSVRFLVSAHAATEELFVLKQMVEGLLGADGRRSVTLSWNHREKPQPAGAKFRVTPTDAPNVNGARDLGFAVGRGNDGPAGSQRRFAPPSKLDASKRCTWSIRVRMGRIGDVSWVVAARRSGKLPLLIVQGVVMTDLASGR